MVVVLAVDLFLDGVPTDVLDEKLDELGIDRRAFTRRRRAHPALHAGLAAAHHAPGARTSSAMAGDTLHNSGLGPTVRAWINN